MGPQQREIGFPISTEQCKLAGPQHREFQKEILQTMQVGGAPHREFQKEILQTMQVGQGSNIRNTFSLEISISYQAGT
ncbi:hypothetical protein UM538_13880 [Staphylococcus aureus]|nr:hypothetical protein UM538_13880 [Staphylococcus aureus]